MQPLTFAQVDLNTVRNNIREIRRLALKNKLAYPSRFYWTPQRIRKMDIVTVVKADAYGHGMVNVAQTLVKLGINFFGVSDIFEGIYLRKAGIKKNILLFESTMPSQAAEIFRYQLTPTISSYDLAKTLDSLASRKNTQVPVHVKVDTGMTRLGVWHEEAFEFIKKLQNLHHISIQGIYTHFPSADTDAAFTKQQMGELYNLVMRLDKAGLVIPFIHAANSMGLAGYKTDILNLSRPGLMIYGLYPSNKLKKTVKLKPALSVYSKTIFVKKIEKGRSVSYGRTFVAKKNMTVATIPIGYSDGYFRIFSNRGHVLVGGKKCPILGRVTMDQIVVDVSKVKNPHPGMPVVILGKQGKEEITADDLAFWGDTINYEIVCSLGNLLPRKSIG